MGSAVSKEPGGGDTGERGGRAGVQGHPRSHPGGTSWRGAIFKMGPTRKLVSRALCWPRSFLMAMKPDPVPRLGDTRSRQATLPGAGAHLHEQVTTWAGGQRPAANQTPPVLYGGFGSIQASGPQTAHGPGRHRGWPQPSAGFIQPDSHPQLKGFRKMSLCDHN